MKLNVVPKRESKRGLWYLKADDEIIKRSFKKKKLIAIKQKIESGEISIDDVRYQTILEKEISEWEEVIE